MKAGNEQTIVSKSITASSYRMNQGSVARHNATASRHSHRHRYQVHERLLTFSVHFPANVFSYFPSKCICADVALPMASAEPEGTLRPVGSLALTQA